MILLIILSMVSLISILALMVENAYLIFLGLTNLSQPLKFHLTIWTTNIISFSIASMGLYIFNKSIQLNEADGEVTE